MKIANSLLALLLFQSLFLIGSNANAANTHIDSAMKLYKSMEINKAVAKLIINIDDINTLNSVEKIKYALIINKNLSIYRDIYSKSLDTQQIFLESLINDKGKGKSLVAPLFLTEIYILQKELNKAEQQLNKFKENLKRNNKNAALEPATNIYNAWIALVKGDTKRFKETQKKIDLDDPLSAMALDVIQILTTGKSTIELSFIKAAEDKYIIEDEIKSVRFANYAIRIYSHRGELSKARSIVKLLDQKRPSYTEEISQFKLIKFYEPSLIDSVATFYYKLAKSILEELEKDTKYHDMAIYYLSDLELITSNTTSAKRFKEQMLTLTRLPKSLSSLLAIRQNGHAYLYGKTTRAYQAWEKAVNNAKNNPSIGAEAILMCIYLDASCPTIVQTAQLKAENGKSKLFENLNTNVGRYFLLKKENIKAMRLLENALDRGNAGGILMNEPILLLNLAEIYRLNKRYSESLQIYFSLGQNFPILRQVQDAVQGEYLFRQRSTGSNIVF
ncbi:MAG: hypothetical protein OEM38_03025 [Gammaproteobacteria bacterium]|nr:hypothetical protein [Gammaproteobacteria bacterium]